MSSIDHLIKLSINQSSVGKCVRVQSYRRYLEATCITAPFPLRMGLESEGPVGLISLLPPLTRQW